MISSHRVATWSICFGCYISWSWRCTPIRAQGVWLLARLLALLIKKSIANGSGPTLRPWPSWSTWRRVCFFFCIWLLILLSTATVSNGHHQWWMPLPSAGRLRHPSSSSAVIFSRYSPPSCLCPPTADQLWQSKKEGCPQQLSYDSPWDWLLCPPKGDSDKRECIRVPQICKEICPMV